MAQMTTLPLRVMPADRDTRLVRRSEAMEDAMSNKATTPTRAEDPVEASSPVQADAPLSSIFIVMTDAYEGQEDEFNDWYTNIHCHDTMRFKGSVAVQRWKLSR